MGLNGIAKLFFLGRGRGGSMNWGLRRRQAWRVVRAGDYGRWIKGGLLFLAAGVMAVGQLLPGLGMFGANAVGGVPIVSEVLPDRGLVAGGDLVDVLGENFMIGEEVQFAQIASGGSHTLAIDSAGQLYSWGANNKGQLGNNALGTDSYSAVHLSSTADFGGVANPLHEKSFRIIAAGGDQSFAVDGEGQLYAWGSNDYGQIGNNAVGVDAPIAVNLSVEANFSGTTNPLFGKTFQAIASGVDHVAAVAYSGELYVWGRNSVGQLGNNSTGTDAPVAISLSTISNLSGTTNPLYPSSYLDVAAGGNHTMAISVSGELYVWGLNDTGQIGNNTVTNQEIALNLSSTQTLSGGITNQLYNNTFKSVAAGANHSLAVAYSGDLYSWGSNDAGQLGNGSIIQSNVAINLTATADFDGTTNPLYSKRALSVAAGDDHSTAISSSRELYVWGSNSQGQIGTGSSAGVHDTAINLTMTTDFGEIDNPLYDRRFQVVSAGSFQSFAIDSSGQLHAWGKNNKGQLGDGSTANSDVAINLSEQNSWPIPSTGKTIKTFSARSHTVYAIDSSGRLYAWGLNDFGQIGDNSTQNALTPVNLSAMPVLKDGVDNPLYGKKIIDVSAGGSRVLVLDDRGNVYTWGNNTLSSPIGNNSTGDVHVPVNLSSVPNFSGMSNSIYNKTITAVFAGSNSSFAIDDAGLVYAWGNNNYGKLGLNTTNRVVTPRNVSSAYLGSGTTNVLNGKRIKAVGSDSSNTVLLDSSGRVYTIGYSGFGLLGDNKSTGSYSYIALDISTPSSFNGASNPFHNRPIRAVNHFFALMHAVDGAGQLYSWGTDPTGMLQFVGVTDPYGQKSTPLPVNLSAIPTFDGKSNTIFGETVAAIPVTYGRRLVTGAGQLYAWGLNSSGQIGNNSTENLSIPINLSAVETFEGGIENVLYKKTIRSVSGSNASGFALDSQGQLYGWGSGSSGQLGNGAAARSLFPIAITVPNQIPNIDSVTFGGVEAMSFEVVSDTLLRAVTPAHAAGWVDVVATNKQGQSSAPLEDGYLYYTVPSAPVLTDLEADGSEIALTWTAPTSDGYAAITGYLIEVSKDDGATWEVAVANTGNANLTYSYTPDASDGPETIYSFRVSAINTAGTGPASNVLSSRVGFIELTVDTDSVEISIRPSPSGSASSKSHNVSFKTNYANGVVLSMSTASETNNSLVNEADSNKVIAPVTGNMSNPAVLTGNTWGFAIANSGTNISNGFDAGYVEELNVQDSQSHFAAVPMKGSAVDIKSSDIANPTVPNTTRVYFGASADLGIPAGRYSTTVIYSVVGN